MARGSIHGPGVGQGFYTWPGVLYMAQGLARGSIHVHGQGLARGTIHGQGLARGWPGVLYMARGTILYSTWPYMYTRGSCPSVGKDFEMPTRTEAGG